MVRPKSEDPAVPTHSTMRESLVKQVDKVRGDVPRSKWIERAVEQRLEREGKK
jgi:hypothetical protein